MPSVRRPNSVLPTALVLPQHGLGIGYLLCQPVTPNLPSQRNIFLIDCVLSKVLAQHAVSELLLAARLIQANCQLFASQCGLTYLLRARGLRMSARVRGGCFDVSSHLLLFAGTLMHLLRLLVAWPARIEACLRCSCISACSKRAEFPLPPPRRVRVRARCAVVQSSAVYG